MASTSPFYAAHLPVKLFSLTELKQTQNYFEELTKENTFNILLNFKCQFAYGMFGVNVSKHYPITELFDRRS